MEYLCDTNYILRYLIQDDKDQFSKAKELFELLKQGRAQATLEQAVFVEVIFVLSSYYKIPREKISSILSALLTYKGLKCEKFALLQALEYYSKYKLHIVDCLLLAKSEQSKKEILTFDTQLKRIGESLGAR